jgi:hypothetical protein
VAHWFRAQTAAYDAAVLFTPDQSGVRQHVEMLHDRRQRHRKRLGEQADRQIFFLAQLGKQGAPGWIGKCREDAIEVGFLIVNHLVKYKSIVAAVKTRPRDLLFVHKVDADR